MALIRATFITDYKDCKPAYNAMRKAGYVSTEYYIDNFRSYWIAFFDDNTKIDSREGGGLAKFHNRVYNE
jgi:hypothetical protein